MKCTALLKREDLLALHFYTWKTTQAKARCYTKQRYWTSTLYMAIGLAGWVLLKDLGTWTYFFCTFSLLWFFFYPTFYEQRFFRAFKKHYNKHYTKAFSKEQTFETQETGLCVTSEGKQADIPWSAIQSIETTSDHCFLYFQQNEALVISRKSLESNPNNPTWEDWVGHIKQSL